MRLISINYREDVRRSRRRLELHRAWVLTGLPRPVLWCRLAGHRWVVDGTFRYRPDGPAPRWVCCDRCGVRPDPQGSLDPDQWETGDRYRGAWLPHLPKDEEERFQHLFALKDEEFYPPGEDVKASGEVRIEVSTRPTDVGISFGIPHAGGDNDLEVSVRLWLLAVFVSLRGFGGGLQRRLNPDHGGRRYEEREWSVSVDTGRLWWQAGYRLHSVTINPLDILLGPKQYKYTEFGQRDTTVVKIPGDDTRYQLQLVLRQVEGGRKRGPKKRAWMVDWRATGGIGLPSGKPGRSVTASSVRVRDAAVHAGMWQAEAAGKVIEWAMEQRDRAREYDGEPTSDSIHEPPPGAR